MEDPKTTKSAPVTVAEIEKIAATRLSRPVLKYYTDGADEQHTARRNKAVFDE